MRNFFRNFYKMSFIYSVCVFCTPAIAATVIVNRDIPVPFRVSDTLFISPSQEGNPFFLSVGDTFIYNIRFTGNPIQIYRNLGNIGPSFFSPSLRPPGSPPLPNTAISSTSVLSLLDQSGNVIISSNAVSFTDQPRNPGYGSPGRSFGAVDFPPEFRTGITRFAALRVIGTVDSFGDPSVVSLEYDRLFLTLGLNTPPGGVPEPATWATMLLGFGGIGAAMRAKRRRELPGFSR
jgi:hypothetical protein